MIQRVDNTEYYELICNQCGKVGVKEDSFKNCIAHAKKFLWKSKSVRTNDYNQRYLFSHLCQKCKNNSK